MTDAEVLRAAAARIRDVAAKAVAGPWESLDNGDRLVAWRAGPGGFDDDFEYVNDEPLSHGGSAAWMALVNPELAEPLAALLDQTAEQVAGSEEAGFDCRIDGSRYLPALKVADAVMGEAQ